MTATTTYIASTNHEYGIKASIQVPVGTTPEQATDLIKFAVDYYGDQYIHDTDFLVEMAEVCADNDRPDLLAILKHPQFKLTGKPVHSESTLCDLYAAPETKE